MLRIVLATPLPPEPLSDAQKELPTSTIVRPRMRFHAKSAAAEAGSPVPQRLGPPVGCPKI